MIGETENGSSMFIDEDSKSGESKLVVGVLVAVLVVLILVAIARTRTRSKLLLLRLEELLWSKNNPPLLLLSCPNPYCIRCQRYRQIQSRAKTRMPWVARQVRQDYPDEEESSLDRLCDSIQNPQRHGRARVQAPTVLMVRDLPSQEVVTDVHSSLLTRHLLVSSGNEGKDSFVHHDILLAELSNAPPELWNRNDTPSGSWEVLPLLNQGQWSERISTLCPRLYHLIRNMPNLLDDCLFGNAMVSKIYPGTCIEAHCGPTNVRHRLQYTLCVPGEKTQPTKGSSSNDKPFLRVGTDTLLSWSEPGQFFVFDDSFIHSVHYDDQGDDCASILENRADGQELVGHSSSQRIVLIVDLWNPHLTQGERALIRYMYPPYFSQTTKNNNNNNNNSKNNNEEESSSVAKNDSKKVK